METNSVQYLQATALVFIYNLHHGQLQDSKAKDMHRLTDSSAFVYTANFGLCNSG